MLVQRPRRNRKSAAIRALVQETRLHPHDFVAPYFVVSGKGIKEPIPSFPGVYRWSIDLLLEEAKQLCALGIPAIALFPVIPSALKNPYGSEALNPDGILQQAIASIKNALPHLCVVSDIALDPYTSHGHDGLVSESGEILNDPTVEILAESALVQARAGVDMVAPSDMMDGRVKAIRKKLDGEGFTSINIVAYTAKYASSLYGPFRDTLSSHLAFGNKMSYFMNPGNHREALLEASLDEDEGADILMVKPALFYLDIIAKLRALSTLPIAAYQVSGEYAMLRAAAERGWLDWKQGLMESLLSIKRAGADLIFTYAAKEAVEILSEKD